MTFKARFFLAWLLVLKPLAGVHSQADRSVGAYLRQNSATPVNYVVSKAASHRITLIGEGHWLKQDASLIAELVPRLQNADIDLASELFPASEQARIDQLVTAPAWDEKSANAVMRAASWPYQEYRDILRAAWSANRSAKQRITILALGPPEDWRSSLLPRGITYDSFMANLVARHVDEGRRRVVVYAGAHHAFSRYYQAELTNAGVARGYMDRMGNILSRRFGEQVFLIALHKPIWCGDLKADSYSYCLPFGGRLDCEATKIGRPMGFDVVGTPLADMRFESGDYYLYGHPGLRFVDYTDGYIWSSPIESFRPVTIIPLSEYAPDDEAIRQVTNSNPFNGEKDVSINRLREIWKQETEAARNIMEARRWKNLVGWQKRCR